MSMCDGAPEIRHFELMEWINQDEIPEDIIDDKLAEYDENTHLGDYPGETDRDYHYTEEYVELRRIGLSHIQAEKVITHG